jgi:hypothetical protein
MNEKFKKSIIVAAHPDDEILWFSSILNKVDQITICFLDIKSKPEVSIGRKKCIDSYPKKNISCLNIDEAEVFEQASWTFPVITEYGIKIENKLREEEYIKNYYKLKEKLDEVLKFKFNVITHNPWGEYGHEEHIQVYRAVKDLQAKYKFNIWFDNYCSNKSYTIMNDYMNNNDFIYYSMKTDKELAMFIKKIYVENGCWTWSDNFQWFEDESFITEGIPDNEMERFSKVFPINIIKDRHWIEQLYRKKKNNRYVDLFASIKNVWFTKCRNIVGRVD